MTRPNEPKPEDLTREKSLWQVYRASDALPTAKWSQWAKGVVVSALTAYVTGLASSGQNPALVADTVRTWANDGLGFASQVIGFVLAGFTIFATMNSREFTLRLARTLEPKSGSPFLKYIYLSFMRVFTVYLGFIAACLAVKLLGASNSFLTFMVGILPNAAQGWVKGIVASAAYVTLGSWFWFVVIDLVAFTFNVYHTVMSSVRWDVEEQLREEAEEAERAAAEKDDPPPALPEATPRAAGTPTQEPKGRLTRFREWLKS